MVMSRPPFLFRSANAETCRSVYLSIHRSWISRIGTALRKCSFFRPWRRRRRDRPPPAPSGVSSPRSASSPARTPALSVRPSRAKSRSSRERRVGSARALKTRVLASVVPRDTPNYVTKWSPVKTLSELGQATLGVLGPLLPEGDAGPVRIGSARQRRLLAALTAHLGPPSHPAPGRSRLGGDPPATRPARCRPASSGCAACCPPPCGCPRPPRATGSTPTLRTSTSQPSPTTSPRQHPSTTRRALRPSGGGAGVVAGGGSPYPEQDHPELGPEVARLAACRDRPRR